MEYVLKVQGKQVEHVPVDDVNNIKELQHIVGGYVEQVHYNYKLAKAGITMLVDEEGKLKDLDMGMLIIKGNKIHEVLVGPVVFLGECGYGEFKPLTYEQELLIRDHLKLVTLDNGNQLAAIEYETK